MRPTYSHGQTRVDISNTFLYIINKAFFTLLSITMKWINLWIKMLQIISTRNCLQFNTTTVTLHKSKKYQGVKEKKHDFEMSMPSCRMCCTIMVHFIGVPIIKSFYPLVQNHCYIIIILIRET